MRTKRLILEVSIMTVLLVVLPAITVAGQGGSGRAPQGGSGRSGVSKPTKPSGKRNSTAESINSAAPSLQQTLKMLKEALSNYGNFTIRDSKGFSKTKSLTPIKFDECTIEFRESRYDTEDKFSYVGSSKLNLGDVKPDSIDFDYMGDEGYLIVILKTFGMDIKSITERLTNNPSLVGESMTNELVIDVRNERAAKIIVNYLKRAVTLCRSK